jgi:hypothetical protein
MSSLNIISIDIGLRNLAICKESYNIKSILNIKSPCEFYDNKGCALPDMIRFVKDIGKHGKLMYWERKDLGDKKCFHAGYSYITLIEWLDKLYNSGIFNDVHTILIEQQMKTNNIALSIMHHIHCYFKIKYKLYKNIILYPSKNKTRILGAALMEEKCGKMVKISKYQRKTWSVKYITNLLQERKDDKSLTILTSEKKKDDLSDVIAQLLSYVVKEVCKEKKIKLTFTTLKQTKKLYKNNKEMLLS